VVADADALIALVNTADALHQSTVAISQRLVEIHSQVVFPVTAIAEALTTLQRKLDEPTMVIQVVDLLAGGKLRMCAVSPELLKEAVSLFNPAGSKQDTMHDAIVAAVAQQLKADAIFSFDAWYKRKGFTLAGELMAQSA
jgi:predicted nucleic acid-binding protein